MVPSGDALPPVLPVGTPASSAVPVEALPSDWPSVSNVDSPSSHPSPAANFDISLASPVPILYVLLPDQPATRDVTDILDVAINAIEAFDHFSSCPSVAASSSAVGPLSPVTLATDS